MKKPKHNKKSKHPNKCSECGGELQVINGFEITCIRCGLIYGKIMYNRLEGFEMEEDAIENTDD